MAGAPAEHHCTSSYWWCLNLSKPWSRICYTSRRASSSAVERLAYTEEVAGSTPASPTKQDKACRSMYGTGLSMRLLLRVSWQS
jgi:hypothetical protein